MRPVLQRLIAIGNGQWVPLNYIQTTFQVGLFIYPGTGVTLAAKVQLAADDPVANIRPVSITRVTTTATVVDTAHGLVTGDSIIVTSAGAPFDTSVSPFSADITVVDANSYTYVVANTGPTTANVNAKVQSYRVFDHATLAAVTARANGNVAFPIKACRLQVSALSGGAVSVDFIVLQGSSAS